MAIKRLSSPFPTAIFPDSSWAATEIRAAWSVGYPLAATAPAPPAPAPAPEEAPVVIRVPSIRIPMVYKDILHGWMEPWRGRILESRKGRALIAMTPHLRTNMLDKIRMAEEMRCGVQLLIATSREVFKAKELLTGEETLNMIMSDKFRFGIKRRLLIDRLDRWLGIQLE